MLSQAHADHKVPIEEGSVFYIGPGRLVALDGRIVLA